MSFKISSLNFVFIVCAVLCGFASSLHAQSDLPQLPAADQSPDEILLDKPIKVLDANSKPQLLVGVDGDNLRLALPNMPGAEAVVPANSKGMMFRFELPRNYNRILQNLDLGNYQAALEDLRPYATPLTPFLIIPPDNTNIHNIHIRFYKAEVMTGNVGEAVELSLQMPWGRLNSDYVDLGEQLLYRTMEEGEFDLTQKLLSLFYREMSEEQFSEIAFRVADTLRTLKENELAGMVYGSLARSSDPVLREKSLLWAGYSRAVSGDAQGAREILNRVEPLQRDDENFLTYCLAQGRLGYVDGNISEGLRYLSRAMVLTGVGATFKPELYYLLTYGYRQSGNTEAADRLALELAIFYPESPWLKKYQSESDTSL